MPPKTDMTCPLFTQWLRLEVLVWSCHRVMTCHASTLFHGYYRLKMGETQETYGNIGTYIGLTPPSWSCSVSHCVPTAPQVSFDLSMWLKQVCAYAWNSPHGMKQVETPRHSERVRMATERCACS